MVYADMIAFGRPSIGDAEIAAVEQVMRRGWLGMGPETIAFEQELAAYMGVPDVVTVTSCTDALFLALKISGVGPGDEVIAPSLTWCSTANAAIYLGANPIFCDIDPMTFSVTVENILGLVTPRTKAVVPVHFGGLAIDVAELRRRLPDRVAVVEDAAHALGGRYPGGPHPGGPHPGGPHPGGGHPDGGPGDGAAGGIVGASGGLVCFSFYSNKNLSTGEGGAVACPDRETGDRLRSLRLHGLPADAWQRHSKPELVSSAAGLSELGYKMNYTDLQAAVGRVQLRRQTEFAAIRRAVSAIYCKELARRLPQIDLQADLSHPRHALHLFPILLPRGVTTAQRDQCVADLRRRRVGACVHYPPLHQMPLYAPRKPLPVTEDVAPRIMTLPIGAKVTPEDAETAIDIVIDSIEKLIA